MKTTSAMLALASAVSGHIVLTNPKPFATNNGNGPIHITGSNYPCAASSFDQAPTAWKAGETMPIKVMGGATHSGGSCQYSITPDTKPSKDSQFKVIHSVIGGCISPRDGNDSGSATYSENPVVNVKLPEDLPAGQYTFSWSWLNKSGNREFYQNCAPITVTSSSKKSVSEAIGSLPDMFVMNLPDHLTGGCSQPEGIDFEYPNPGKSVQKLPVGKANYKGVSALIGDKAKCDAIIKLGAGNGKLGSPGAGSPTKPEPTTPTKPTSPPANSGVVGAPTPTPKPQPQPQPETPPPAAGSVACTANGSIVCIGSSQFGLCNNGAAIPQALAAGTKCQNGAIVRRSVRAPRRHLARAHARNLI